ncbi:MAG: hypothetical protein ACRDYF_00950 [Acidimicrobiia bacterium]
MCGATTTKRAVSPFEVSARYCGQCQTAVEGLERLADCIQAALRRGATWDDVSQAFGTPADEIKRAYASWETPDKNWGWG